MKGNLQNKANNNQKVRLKEKGITIISLVVTIIILLILAGVTIGTVTGDNGLFKRAGEAVEESKKASYQEELTTIGLGIKLEKASTPISSKEFVDLFEEEMNRQIVGSGIFKDSNIRRKNDETLRVETKEGYIYYVREDETLYIGKAGEVDESEIPDITLGDIVFNYSTEDWTNQDVTVELSIGENVENKENYIIEYSKDAKNWTRYTSKITMTENGEIYARAKDKFGDIKVEKYATGEVQNIDKNAPTPGSIIMKMASSKAPYSEGTEVYQNVTIELENGQDNEGESGHNLTTCTVTGLAGVTSLSKGQEPVLLKTKDENYVVTAQITTSDVAGNTVTVEKDYTIRTIYAKENKSVTVSDGTFYVPEGFKLAEDSGATVNEGIVVEDKNENQWVWIPCYVDGGVGEDATNTIKYDRYAFSSVGMGQHSQSKLSKTVDGAIVPDLDNDGSQKIVREDTKNSYHFHEAININDQTSISHFGGYYIGRYEAGDKESTLAKEMRLADKYYNEGRGDATHTVTIKKGQAPYTFVTQEQCEILASGIASSNNYDTSKMYTKICSSYAWDTALMFIGESYATNSTQGNYKAIKLSYRDITEELQTKNSGDGIVIPTGQTTSTKKIYDMGGNVWEYTSESLTYGPYSFVDRGGCYADDAETFSAGYRDINYGGYYGDFSSFRPTLYLKNNA